MPSNIHDLKNPLIALSIIYFFGGLAALILSLIYGFNKEHFGVVFLIGALIPIIILKRRMGDSEPEIKREPIMNHSSLSLKLGFFLFLVCIIAILIGYRDWSVHYSLPVWFFIIIAFAGLIILIQIVNYNSKNLRDTVLLIIEIFSLAIIISASFLFLFPTPYGNDAPYHVGLINWIATTGHTNGYFGQYENYPIFHIIFVIIQDVLNMNILETAFIMSFIQISFGSFLFLLMRRPFGNRIALISLLLISIAPNFLISRYSFFPGSFSAIFLIFLMYLLIKNKIVSRINITILFLIVIFEAILIHPLLPIFILAVLFLIRLSRPIFSSKSEPSSISTVISSALLATIAILTIFWWARPFQGGYDDILTVFMQSLKNAFIQIDFSNVSQATLAPGMSYIDILLADLGFLLLIFMAIIGSFLLLTDFLEKKELIRRKNIIDFRMISFATLALIPIPFILTVIFPNSLPARWFPFLEILCSIGAGISIFLSIATTRKIILKVLSLAMFFILVFFMISSPTVNPNSGIYASDLATRSALTVPELHAAQFIDSLNASEINANSKYVFLDSTRWINPEKANTYSSGLTVIRDYDLKEGFTIPLFGQEGFLLKIEPANDTFKQALSTMNLIYDIGSVVTYQR